MSSTTCLSRADDDGEEEKGDQRRGKPEGRSARNSGIVSRHAVTPIEIRAWFPTRHCTTQLRSIGFRPPRVEANWHSPNHLSTPTLRLSRAMARLSQIGRFLRPDRDYPDRPGLFIEMMSNEEARAGDNGQLGRYRIPRQPGPSRRRLDRKRFRRALCPASCLT